MSYNRDPLYYHTKVNFDELLEKREKAIWLQIDGVKTWMPIKCCRELNEKSKTVYIWTKVLESNMMKAREYIKNLKARTLKVKNLNWNKLYDYPKTVRSSVDGVRTYNIGQEKLPSVTTILQGTQDPEKAESLARWKAKVGNVEATRIKNTAALRGTAMHTYLEHYVKGGNVLDLTDLGREASSMGQTIIEKGFPDMEEVWGVECTLRYPGLYAGQTDLCGIYQGRESIVDFKQSNKPKKAEWIDDYKLQLVAYAMAHDQVYGTKIEQGVILMCTPDNFFQRFLVNGGEFREWKWEWLRRVDTYYGRNVAKS